MYHHETCITSVVSGDISNRSQGLNRWPKTDLSVALKERKNEQATKTALKEGKMIRRLKRHF